MKCLIFITPSDFRDETLNTVRAVFDKWGVDYAVSSYSKRDCTGFHGEVCRPDVNTMNVNPSDYDAIMVIDGNGVETQKIYEYRPLLDVIYSFYKAGKFVCAIGNGIKVLARANIVKEKRVAVSEDQSTKNLVMLFHGMPSRKELEVHDRLCTIGDNSTLDTTLPQMLSYLGVK